MLIHEVYTNVIIFKNTFSFNINNSTIVILNFIFDLDSWIY